MKTKYMKVADGRRNNIEQYPNFSISGSIKGMREKFYGKNALLVRCGSFIYHVSKRIYDMAY